MGEKHGWAMPISTPGGGATSMAIVYGRSILASPLWLKAATLPGSPLPVGRTAARLEDAYARTHPCPAGHWRESTDSAAPSPRTPATPRGSVTLRSAWSPGGPGQLTNPIPDHLAWSLRLLRPQLSDPPGRDGIAACAATATACCGAADSLRAAVHPIGRTVLPRAAGSDSLVRMLDVIIMLLRPTLDQSRHCAIRQGVPAPHHAPD